MSLLNLPDDLIVKCCANLLPDDLSSLERVCTRLHRLLTTCVLWRQACSLLPGDPKVTTPATVTDWKAHYLRCLRLPCQLTALFVGASNAGRTSMLDRWISGHYRSNVEPTVGSAYVKTSILNPRRCELRCFDVSGQPRFLSIVPPHVSACQVIVVTFDLSDEESLQRAQVWLRNLHTGGSLPPLILVGNKMDLPAAVSQHDALAVAAKFGMTYHQCSAKTGSGMFRLLSTMLQRYATFVSEAQIVTVVRRPVWIADNASSRCFACQQQFSFLLRRVCLNWLNDNLMYCLSVSTTVAHAGSFSVRSVLPPCNRFPSLAIRQQSECVANAH